MKKYCIIFFSVFIIFSCKNKEDNKNRIIVEQTSQPVEILTNNDSLIYKLDTNTICILEDTLHIERPYIYSFSGFLDNKKIQIHLYNLLSTEYGGYDKTATLYIDGEYDIYTTWFSSNTKTNTLTSDVVDYDYITDKEKNICKLKVFDISTENMYIECLYKNKTYKIQPSKEFPSYQCYDVIDYILYDTKTAFDKNEAIRPYSPNRDYSFFANIISNNKYYEKLETELKYLFSDSSNIDEHKTWRHQFHIEKPTSDEDYYSYETLSDIKPIFIDSFIYVVSDFSYSYMGGAHGVFTTDYNNYDVKTGKIIQLNDILNIDDDFIDFYNEQIKATYKDGLLSDNIPMSDKFYILPTDITFSYAPYELLGFAAGEPHIFFSFRELSSFIKNNSIIQNYLK